MRQVAHAWVSGLAFRDQVQSLDGLARGAGGVRLDRVQGVAGVIAHRIPSVAQPRGATQRNWTFTTDPQRRMRVLHRFGQKRDIGELRKFAIESRAVLGP